MYTLKITRLHSIFVPDWFNYRKNFKVYTFTIYIITRVRD